MKKALGPKTLLYPTPVLVVGIDVKIDEEALTPEGDADIRKINPFLFDPGARGYYGLGEFLGNAFSVGRDIPGGPSACKRD